ncbi:MAG: calcium-binding protein, partial [Rhodobacteraceae bacterium]|nr:calcium-binding protein [Paracoccaceae bacterium]
MRFLLDIRGVTGFTGTGGADSVRLGQGVSFNLGDGDDSVTGTDDLLQWTLDAITSGTRPEATLSVSYFALPDDPASADTALDWVSLGTSSTVWGADDLTGGDAADRLILDFAGDVKAAFSGDDTDKPELTITYVGAGAALSARGVEELESEATGTSTLDYSAWDSNVSVDFSEGTGTGLDRHAGFNAVITGGGDDQIIAASDTVSIQTGAGADTITLTRFSVAAYIDAGAGEDTLKGDTSAQSDVYTVAESDFAEGEAVPDDLDPDTADIQTTDPLGSHFLISNVDGEGADGTFSLELKAGGTQGTNATFANVENFEGQGSSDDPDTIEFNISPALTWYVTDVYAGAVVVSGALTLGYSNIQRGSNAGSSRLTLTYAGDGNDYGEYTGDVITDLMEGAVAGFQQFSGAVHVLIGSSKNDALTGGEATEVIRGLSGDDLLAIGDIDFTSVTPTIEGGAGTDTLGYGYASQDIFVLDDGFHLVSAAGDLAASYTGISDVVLLAKDGLATGITLDASAFTLGSVALRGGDGADSLIGSAGDDSFQASMGADAITGTDGTDRYYAIDVAGNWTVVDASADIHVTKNTGDTDTLSGTFDQLTLSGDESDNTFDASGLTLAAVSLLGNDGDDVLKGGSQDDTLSGGAGADSFDGGSGDDLLVEQGLRQYILTDSALIHDRTGDTDYTLSLDLPESTATDDFLRLTLVLADGTELTSGKLSFQATDADVIQALRGFQQFDPESVEITISRNATTGAIEAVDMAFTYSYQGRDLGLSLKAAGEATPDAGSATAFTAETTGSDITAGTREGSPETVANIERAEFAFDTSVAGYADVSGFSGSVMLTGSSLN